MADDVFRPQKGLQEAGTHCLNKPSGKTEAPFHTWLSSSSLNLESPQLHGTVFLPSHLTPTLFSGSFLPREPCSWRAVICSHPLAFLIRWVHLNSHLGRSDHSWPGRVGWLVELGKHSHCGGPHRWSWGCHTEPRFCPHLSLCYHGISDWGPMDSPNVIKSWSPARTSDPSRRAFRYTDA